MTNPMALPEHCTGILIVAKGTEFAAQRELSGFSISSTVENGAILFPTTGEALVRIAYLGHSFSQLLVHLGQGTIENNRFKELPEALTFLGNFGKASTQIAGDVGEKKEEMKDAFQEQTKEFLAARKLTVPAFVYNNADVSLVVIIDGTHWMLGLEPFQIDFSKRTYKVFLHRTSMKGGIAYAALSAGGFDNGKSVIDPFCGSGMIPIEAALYARGFPLFFYDKRKLVEACIYKEQIVEKLEKFDKEITPSKSSIYAYDDMMGSVRITQKNAKIGGVEKDIIARRVGIDWVDVKFAEKSVDCIVTEPPRVTRNFSANEAKKLLKLLFQQAQYVLKKDGNVTITGTDMGLAQEIGTEMGFTKVMEKEVYQGKERMIICVFGRAV